MELKFNETNQLRTRLAILESQLKFANKKIKHLKNSNKNKSSRSKLSHAR